MLAPLAINRVLSRTAPPVWVGRERLKDATWVFPFLPRPDDSFYSPKHPPNPFLISSHRRATLPPIQTRPHAAHEDDRHHESANVSCCATTGTRQRYPHPRAGAEDERKEGKNILTVAISFRQYQPRHHPRDDAGEQENPLRRPQRAQWRARALHRQQSDHLRHLHVCQGAD
jgi:hypothetical protein